MSGFHPRDLIKEVKCRPAIFNRELLEQPRREHKHHLWLEVAGNLTPAEDWNQYSEVEKDARIDEIQAKWKHLKDHFHRELKLIDAGEAHKKRKYVYFDDMEFMRPFVGLKLAPPSKRAKHDSMDSMEDESMNNVTEGDMDTFLKANDSVEEDTRSPNKRPKRNIKPSQKAIQKYTSTPTPKRVEKDAVIKNFDVLKKTNKGGVASPAGPNPTFKIRDGDISFCLSLVPNLRKLGDSKKLRAKIEILKVLHKYVDHNETSRYLNRSAAKQPNNNNSSHNDDDTDMPEDHLDDFEDVGGGDVNIKHEAYVDPLNSGSSGNTKTWWT